MKLIIHLIFSALLMVLPSTMAAQQKMPPLPANKDTHLVHQIALISKDKSLGQQIDSLVQQQIDKNVWSIQLSNNVKNYPDVVILLDGDSTIL